MPVTHVYRHPEEKGLGQHHAEAEGREPFDKEAAIAGGMSQEHAEIIDAEYDRQRKLDLSHATGVEFDYIHPDTGLYHVTWTDFFGTSRMTSIEPGVFEAMFEEHPDYDGPLPTHASVQEHDYHRGTFERPAHRLELRTVSIPVALAEVLAEDGHVHADHGLLGGSSDPSQEIPAAAPQVASHLLPAPAATEGTEA